jgi:hypothetical protein
MDSLTSKVLHLSVLSALIEVYFDQMFFWERLTNVEQGMCWIWFSPNEVEYTSEDKIVFLFDVLLQW